MQNLIDYTIKNNHPAAMRAEVVDVLGIWADPSVLDRVDGRYRGVFKKDPVILKNKVSGPLLNLLRDKDLAVRLSAANSISILEIKEAGPILYGLVKTDQEPDMRIESLKALVSLNDPRIADAVSLALRDHEKKVRIEALGLLQKMAISKDLMVTLLSEVIATKTIEEKQAAILTLGNMPAAYSPKSLGALLDQMSSGHLSPDLYFELGEAVDSSHSPGMIARYKSISHESSARDPAASFAGSLYGGDPVNGKYIFFENQNAQCMRCHSYDDQGGNAGPRLNGIASRISRQQILEALINPSARLSPGYGMVSLELKSGQPVSGILEAEDSSSLTLKIGNQPNQVFQKTQISKRTNAASSMPEMRYILSKKEIRDVVSFLATLKEKN